MGNLAYFWVLGNWCFGFVLAIFRVFVVLCMWVWFVVLVVLFCLLLFSFGFDIRFGVGLV